MKNIGYYNGKTDLIENMTVPMNDRVCWFGDGVYDVSVCLNRNLYLAEQHLDRFYRSASLIHIEIPMTREELVKVTMQLTEQVDSDDTLVYWQVTRGTMPRSHALREKPTANVWMTVKPLDLKKDYGPLRIISYKDERYYYCNIKTLNLLPNCMAEQYAWDHDCNTSVFLRDGMVTECAHSNIHILKDGKIITHPTDNLILPGVARWNLLRLAQKMGIPYEERAFSYEEMKNADEVFTTSTSSPCKRVCELDGKPVGCRDEKTFFSLFEASFADFTEATGKVF